MQALRSAVHQAGYSSMGAKGQRTCKLKKQQYILEMDCKVKQATIFKVSKDHMPPTSVK